MAKITAKDLYEQFLNETGFSWVLVSEDSEKEWWWYDVQTPGGIVCVDFAEKGVVEVSNKTGSYSSIPFQRMSIADPNCFETIERILRERRSAS